MAADNDVDIKIKLSADKRGGDEVTQTMDRVEKKAKSTADSTANAFKEASRSVSAFGKVLRSITKISFVAGSLSSVISLWDSLHEKARKAREEAAEFAKETEKAADAERIDKLAESYRKLGEEIGNAAKARQRANELEDMQTSEADKLEDSEAQLKKTQAIAALDPSDPAYEQKKRQIEAEYEAEAAKRNVARTKRDAETKERREYAEAEAKYGEATDKEFSLIADREELATLRRKANEAKAASVQENQFDVKTFTEGFVNNLRSILSLDGNHFWSDRTARGDEERKRQEEEAKRYDEQAKALEKKIKDKEDEIKSISDEATHHSKKAGIYGMSAVNTAVAQENAELSGKTATDQAAAEVARREKEIADAKALLASGEGQAAQYRSQIAANNRQITDTSYQVATGKMGVDAGSSAVNKLQESNRELNELLQNLLREIEQSKQVIKKANEQARNSRGVDSTEGA